MIRELFWIAIAGWVWGCGQCIGWRHALWARDHADEIQAEIRRRVPRVFYRAFEQ